MDALTGVCLCYMTFCWLWQMGASFWRCVYIMSGQFGVCYLLPACPLSLFFFLKDLFLVVPPYRGVSVSPGNKLSDSCWKPWLPLITFNKSTPCSLWTRSGIFPIMHFFQAANKNCFAYFIFIIYSTIQKWIKRLKKQSHCCPLDL